MKNKKPERLKVAKNRFKTYIAVLKFDKLETLVSFEMRYILGARKMNICNS